MTRPDPGEDPASPAATAARIRALDEGISFGTAEVADGDLRTSSTYTVGLTAYDHPELLIIGMPPRLAEGALRPLADLVRQGRRFQPGDVIYPAVIGGEQVHLVIAGPAEEGRRGGRYPITLARAVFHETGVPLPYQVVYPDQAGRFPWDEAYDGTVPLLGPVPGLGDEDGG